MSKFSITVIRGDGIGPEVIDQALKVLKKIETKFNLKFNLDEQLLGGIAIDKTGKPLPKATLDSCKKSDAILLGAIGDPKYDAKPVRPEQGLLALRKHLDLFANLRPIKVYPALANNTPLKKEIVSGVDCMFIRELTSGIYFGKPRERRDNGKTAVDTALYKQSEVERIAKVAFETAMKRSKKLVSVDKANVLETSRLWRETVDKVAKSYPQVEYSHQLVDSMTMVVIKYPKDLDVVLAGNMFGDIITDEASVLAGSIGLSASASIGGKYGMYEPIHGSSPKYTGLNVANPIGTILSVAMMCRYSLNLPKEAQTIETAVEKVIASGLGTKDICKDPKKTLGTRELGDLIAEKI